MSDTTFTDKQTGIVSAWLQDINNFAYRGTLPSGATKQSSSNILFGTRTLTSKLQERYSVLDSTPAADPTGATDSTAAIVAANAAAKAAGVPLHWPSGTYLYTPTAVLEIGNWIGDGPTLTKIKVDCTSYSGVVFRMTGSTEISSLNIYEDGFSALGTGLQLSASDTATFTGYQRLTRCVFQGFAKNVDVNNLFTVVFDQCRFEYGTEGLYCKPADVAGDNGYVTTLYFLGCTFISNTRNVYINPDLRSKSVAFFGGSIEAATGASEQGYFNHLVSLTFHSVYLEGASTIPALRLLDVSQSGIYGAYVNGTGGITLGTNAQLTLENVNTTSSTDVLVGGDGTQDVILRNSNFPSTGNSPWYNWSSFSAQTVIYNGTTYRNFFDSTASGFIDDTYSASITPSLKHNDTLRYTINNGTAFTMNAPTNVQGPGSKLSIIFKNTSGGAVGVITWNAVYKVPTLTLPATGFNRTYDFLYDGTNWVFQRQTATDVPN